MSGWGLREGDWGRGLSRHSRAENSGNGRENILRNSWLAPGDPLTKTLVLFWDTVVHHYLSTGNTLPYNIYIYILYIYICSCIELYDI